MKICLVSHSFLPKIGGAELAVHYLAEELTKIGEKVIVLASTRKLRKQFDSNYKVAYYPLMPRGYLQGYIFAIFMFFLHRRYRFDVIHFHKAQMGYFGTKIKGLINVPIIITTHGEDIQRYYEINYGDRLDPIWNKRIEYAITNADILTAIGSSTRRDYVEIGVAENKIVSIPNGVNLRRFNDTYQDIRSLYGLPKDVKILLSVGRYHVKKGYEYLLKAMPYIIAEYRKVKLIIIGSRLHILNNLKMELNLEEYVIFLGQQSFNYNKDKSQIDLAKIPNDTLLSAYKSSDIYVSSSLIEGFSLVLVEAMAAGLPIVATNVPGNEDGVIDGENGFLVESKDPEALANNIVRLLKNDRLREKLGKKSKGLAKRYDWESITQEYLESYRLLIG